MTLSTPSLGITGPGSVSPESDNVIKLSTPSLGITTQEAMMALTFFSFQLPLSGSRVEFDETGKPVLNLTFNSLSRDHFRIAPESCCLTAELAFNSLSRDHALLQASALLFQHERRVEEVDFQLPLSGSLTQRGSGATASVTAFQLPLSGSQTRRRM